MSPLTLPLAALSLALPLSIAGINIAAALLSAALLLPAKPRRISPTKILTGTFYALSFYLAVGAITAAFGMDPGRSLHEVQKDLHKLWLFLILSWSLNSETSPGLTRLLGAGFAIAAAIGIAQSLFLTEPGQLWTRAHAFVHPVTFGEQMALACLGALCYFRHRGAPAVILLTGLALLFSQTRGAIAGLVAGVLALYALDPGWRKYSRWIWAALVAAVLILAALPTERPWSALLGNHEVSGKINPHHTRLVLWDAAVQMTKDRPWLGVGPGHYGTQFCRYFSGTLDGQAVWTSAHNLFLHQAAERGFLGLGALLALAAAASLRALFRVRENPTPSNLWAASALAAFGVMGMTEVIFQNEQVATLMLFIWVRAEAEHLRRPPGEV